MGKLGNAAFRVSHKTDCRMAMAARVTVVEVEEDILRAGAIDPDDVHTQGPLCTGWSRSRRHPRGDGRSVQERRLRCFTIDDELLWPLNRKGGVAIANSVGMPTDKRPHLSSRWNIVRAAKLPPTCRNAATYAASAGCECRGPQPPRPRRQA